MTSRAEVLLAIATVLAVPAGDARAQPDGGDEIIEDPELSGAPLATPAPPPSAGAPPQGPGASARAVGEARLGVDTDWDRASGEDVVVHRLRLDAEVGQALGTRARAFVAGRVEHVARARPSELPEHVGGTLEARLLDAWVEARIGGADVRAGNQFIPWGRVDVLSPGNVWNPLDLRDPFGDPDALPLVPVPALRVDASPVRWLGVSLVWQPFFVPMRADLLGTDQALLGPGAPASFRALAAPLIRLFGDDVVIPLDDPALGPGPRQNLASSQVGGRLTATFGDAEVGATVFWGLSKLPTLTLSPELRTAIESGPDDTVAWLDVIAAQSEGRPLLSIEYERNVQLVADVETPAGEVLLKGELGFAPRRALVRVDDDECRASCVVHRGVVQGAVQVERIDEGLQLLAEGLVVAATRGPGDGDLLFLGRGRTVVGAVGLVRWAPPESDWDLGGSVIVLSGGPAATAIVRAGRAFGDHVHVEAGVVASASTETDALAPLDGGDLVYLAARVTN